MSNSDTCCSTSVEEQADSSERHDCPFLINKVGTGAGRPVKAIHEQKNDQTEKENLCNDKQKKYHLEKSNEAQLKKKEKMMDTDTQEKRGNPIMNQAIECLVSQIPSDIANKLVMEL